MIFAAHFGKGHWWSGLVYICQSTNNCHGVLLGGSFQSMDLCLGPRDERGLRTEIRREIYYRKLLPREKEDFLHPNNSAAPLEAKSHFICFTYCIINRK